MASRAVVDPDGEVHVAIAVVVRGKDADQVASGIARRELHGREGAELPGAISETEREGRRAEVDARGDEVDVPVTVHVDECERVRVRAHGVEPGRAQAALRPREARAHVARCLVELDDVLLAVGVEVGEVEDGDVPVDEVHLVQDAEPRSARVSGEDADVPGVPVDDGQVRRAVAVEVGARALARARADGHLVGRNEGAAVVPEGQHAVEVPNGDDEVVPAVAVEVEDLDGARAEGDAEHLPDGFEAGGVLGALAHLDPVELLADEDEIDGTGLGLGTEELSRPQVMDVRFSRVGGLEGEPFPRAPVEQMESGVLGVGREDGVACRARDAERIEGVDGLEIQRRVVQLGDEDAGNEIARGRSAVFLEPQPISGDRQIRDAVAVEIAGLEVSGVGPGGHDACCREGPTPGVVEDDEPAPEGVGDGDVGPVVPVEIRDEDVAERVRLRREEQLR